MGDNSRISGTTYRGRLRTRKNRDSRHFRACIWPISWILEEKRSCTAAIWPDNWTLSVCSKDVRLVAQNRHDQRLYYHREEVIPTLNHYFNSFLIDRIHSGIVCELSRDLSLCDIGNHCRPPPSSFAILCIHLGTVNAKRGSGKALACSAAIFRLRTSVRRLTKAP